MGIIGFDVFVRSPIRDSLSRTWLSQAENTLGPERTQDASWFVAVHFAFNSGLPTVPGITTCHGRAIRSNDNQLAKESASPLWAWYVFAAHDEPA